MKKGLRQINYLFCPCPAKGVIMSSRVTEWRHKRGISKKRYPKGDVDYKKVASYICYRYFKFFYYVFRQDALQEIELLSVLAERQNSYGDNTRLGIVRFSRMAQRHFYAACKNYGLWKDNNRYAKREYNICEEPILERG